MHKLDKYHLLEVEPAGVLRRKEHRPGQGSALRTLSPVWDYSGSRMPWLKAGSAPSFQQEIADTPCSALLLQPGLETHPCGRQVRAPTSAPQKALLMH